MRIVWWSAYVNSFADDQQILQVHQKRKEEEDDEEELQVVYWILCRPVAHIYLVSTHYAAASIVSGSFSISFLRFCNGSCLQGNSWIL
jgi:hypothetical protein